MKPRLIPILVLFAPALLLAGFKPGTGWPEVLTPFYHAATFTQVSERTRFWTGNAGIIIKGCTDTASMHPVLSGGRELLALETCGPHTPLVLGQIVQYARGDHQAVLQYIAAVSRDGRYLFLTGVNCRCSEGWLPRTRVQYVVREIITLPATPVVTTATHPATMGYGAVATSGSSRSP